MCFNINVYAWKGKTKSLGKVRMPQQFWNAPTLLFNEENPQRLTTLQHPIWKVSKYLFSCSRAVTCEEMDRQA